MDGGPYIDMSSVAKDRGSGVYNCSYHRMEVKDRNHTGFLMTLQHMGRIFRGYEEAGEECPVATVIGHHPAYQMGACYGGPFEISEYEIIGGYLQEPLRLVPSETWGSACWCLPTRKSLSKAPCYPANAWSKDHSAKSTVIWACKAFSSPHATKFALSLGAMAPCIRRFLHPKETSRGWTWRGKARTAPLSRSCAGRPDRLRQRPACLAQCFHRDEENVGRRSRPGRGGGADLGLGKKRLCLRRRHRRLQSHGNSLGARHTGAAATCKFRSFKRSCGAVSSIRRWWMHAGLRR